MTLLSFLLVIVVCYNLQDFSILKIFDFFYFEVVGFMFFRFSFPQDPENEEYQNLWSWFDLEINSYVFVIK